MAQNFLSDIKLGDNIHIRLGDASPNGDFRIKHNGDHTFMDNHTGNVYIRNYSDDKNIHFQTDDGSGDITDYIVIHGSENIVKFQEHTRHLDNKQARFGTGSDLKIFHDGTNNQIRNEGGSLDFEQHVDDGTIRFYADNGSGGVTTYLTIDGANERILADKHINLVDSAILQLGSSQDLRIYHDGSNSYITDQGTGNLFIEATDHIYFRNAAQTEYTAIFTQNGAVKLYYDNSKKFETTSAGISVTGTATTSGNIISGGHVYLTDGNKLLIGSGEDLQIYHDGSNSFISDQGTGLLKILSNGVEVKNAADNSYMAFFGSTGASELYFNGSKKLETANTGVKVSGDLMPSTDGGAKLGAGSGTNLRWAGIELSNGAGIQWTNGDARIIEGLVNNYSLSFQTYNTSNNTLSTALRLDGDNTATFAGTVKAHGNSDTTPALEIYSDSNHGMRILHRGTDGDFSFERRLNGNNTEFLRISRANGDAKFISKVGIGRSPVGKLTIEGDGGVNSNIFFQQASSQEHRIYAATNNQYNTIGSSSPKWYWGQHQSSGSPTVKMSLVGDALTAGSFVKSGGTSSQYLMADGSVSTSVTDNTKLPLTGGTLTGDLTINSVFPRIYLIDSNNNSDYSIINGNGTLRFYDDTNSADRLNITSGGSVVVNGSSPRDASNPAKFSVQGGMSEFETTLTNNDDWQNSPISILERANIGTGSALDKYSPNLNFHWSGRVSRSLWMDASGNLNYGEYDGNGSPGYSNGILRVQEMHSSVFKDKDSTGYYLDPANTDISLHTAGHVHAGGRLRSHVGSDSGSQLNLWADSSGYGYIAVYDLRVMTGGNNNRTESFRIDNNKLATFQGDVTLGSGSSETRTLTLQTNAEKDTIINFKESTATYGFSIGYYGVANDFIIKRHDNATNGTDVLTFFRENDNAKFEGNLALGGLDVDSAKGLRIKSQSVSTQSSAIEVMDNSGTNAIIRMGEKSTDGGRFHMFDSGNEKIAFYTDGTNNHISAGNLGIGTNTPDGVLDVHGASGRWRVNTYGAMYFRNDSDTGNEQYIHARSDGRLSIGRSATSNWSGSGNATFFATTYDHLTFATNSDATFAGNIHLDTLGTMISFYGNSSEDHAIVSKNLSGNADDDLRINSYGGVFINLDSNGNNDNSADFKIVRHSSTGAVSASDTLFTLRHEDGYATFAGDVQINGDLTITGTSTTVNVEDLNVEQGEITLNYGSGDTSSSADNAGIRIQDAVDASNDATMLWDTTNDRFEFSHGVRAPFFTSDGGRGFKQDSVAFVSTYSNGNDANAANDIGKTANKWRDAYFSGQVNSATISATGNATAASFTGRLQGADTGAPDSTIWCVSGQYTNWGIFYNEGSPDLIEFKSSGTVQASIALDNGNFETNGQAIIKGGDIRISTDGTYGGSYGTVGFGGTSNGSNRVFGHTGTSDGLFLASATGRGIFFRVNGGSTDNISFNSDGSATFTGQLKIESAYPTILLTDTNHNDDWGIYNNNGKFLVYNQTDSVSSFQIDQSNNTTFAGSITVNSNGLLSTASTTSATTTTTIASVAIATYTAAFFDYSIKNGTNVRAGTVVATHDGTNVEFNETSTVDLGDTSDVTLSVDISSGDMRLRATTTSSTWTIKSLIRAI